MQKCFIVKSDLGLGGKYHCTLTCDARRSTSDMQQDRLRIVYAAKNIDITVSLGNLPTVLAKFLPHAYVHADAKQWAPFVSFAVSLFVSGKLQTEKTGEDELYDEATKRGEELAEFRYTYR